MNIMQDALYNFENQQFDQNNPDNFINPNQAFQGNQGASELLGQL